MIHYNVTSFETHKHTHIDTAAEKTTSIDSCQVHIFSSTQTTCFIVSVISTIRLSNVIKSCGKCTQNISPTKKSKCTQCKHYFHYTCAGTTEENFKKMNNIHRGNWQYSTCRVSDPGLGCSTPASGDSPMPASAVISDYNLLDTKIKNIITTKLDEFRSEFKSTIEAKFSELMSTIELLKVENDILRDRIAVIESGQARTGTLEEELNGLKNRNVQVENQNH